MGSKARILGAIGEALDSLDGSRGPTIDLFSGSGVVTAHLARTRPMTAVDIQEYARVLASALSAPARMSDPEAESLTERAKQHRAELEDAIQALDEVETVASSRLDDDSLKTLAAIIESGSLATSEEGEIPPFLQEAKSEAAVRLEAIGRSSTITRLYGGVYFSYRQAAELDGLIAAAGTMPPGRSQDTCLAAVLGAASEAVTSVGSHFAQPLRPRDKGGEPKIAALRAAAQKRTRNVAEIFAARLRRYGELPEPPFPARAVRSDFQTFLEEGAGNPAVVYADPPYTRDHYSRFYHVLETIALGDSPAISEVKVGDRSTVSRGLYREQRHQSPFCIRSQAPAAFESLFVGVRDLGAALVLSYSPYSQGSAARPRPRLMEMEDLVDLAGEHFERVEVRSAGRLRHSKFNRRLLNVAALGEAEELVLCEP
jgi:16S rRNA G966 N2-methylase RsmD